jgi:DNA gyrase subunit A
MVTRKGRIKRVELSEFASVRPSGLIALNLGKGDELGWARLTNGEQEIIIVSTQGQALRYHETEVRAMGRQAAGVRAIRLKPGDAVASMDVIDPDDDLLVVTANGFGKRSPLSEYPVKGRATGGVVTLSRDKLDVTGPIAAAHVVNDDDDLSIISTGGIILRTKIKQVKRAGRATMGVRLINLREGESVASVARIGAKELKVAGVDGDAEDDPSSAGAKPNST